MFEPIDSKDLLSANAVFWVYGKAAQPYFILTLALIWRDHPLDIPLEGAFKLDIDLAEPSLWAEHKTRGTFGGDRDVSVVFKNFNPSVDGKSGAIRFSYIEHTDPDRWLMEGTVEYLVPSGALPESAVISPNVS
jgi:hypothetical protein